MATHRLAHYASDERPWGNFERFTEDEPSTVKIITVKAGEETSLQSHKHREEFWHIISGRGTAVVGDEQLDAPAGSEFFVAREVKHRLGGGAEGMVLLEIAFGDFDENDITRFEDRYGRADDTA